MLLMDNLTEVIEDQNLSDRNLADDDRNRNDNDDDNDGAENDDENNAETTNQIDESDDMKVLLPESIVLRISKEKITGKYNYTKAVKSGFNVIASTFILYLTSNAVQSSHAHGRKFIYPEDVFKALQEADLDSFIDPLRQHQLEYKDQQKQMKAKKMLRRMQMLKEDMAANIASESSF